MSAERQPWDTDAHRERYRKVVMREMTLQQALAEAADEWQQQNHSLMGVVDEGPEERQRALARAIICPE